MEPHHMNLLTGLCFLLISGSCYGSTFHVGGKNGWVIDPRESYNHWAERNRFQVNDTLVFKYKKGEDSVLVVNEEAYKTCNKTNPIETLTDGNSVFKFTRSGPFFFISGHDGKCENGEKLDIVVMAVSHRQPRIVHSTAAPPTPAASAPAVRTTTPAPAKSASAPMASTTVQGTDGSIIQAPAPATSGVASTGFGGWVIGLVLCLVF